MKILRIITRLNIGGPSIQVASLTEKFKEEGHDILLVSGSIEKNETPYDYDGEVKYVSSLKRSLSLFDFKAIYDIYKIIEEFQPDIIHTHTAKAGFVGRIAGFLFNKIAGGNAKIVHTYHGHVFHGYFGEYKTSLFLFLERQLAKITDRLIAISPLQQKELCFKYEIGKNERYEVVPLGFDLSSLLEIPIDPWKEKLNVGIVGRLTDIKDHDSFLDSVKNYQRHSKGESCFTFYVIGDGELRTHLEKRNLNELGGEVRFLGWQEKEDIYNKIDLLVLTSKNEGTPVVIIEAMAAGKAVVASDVGGVKDLFATPRTKLAPGVFAYNNGWLLRKDSSFVDNLSSFFCTLQEMLNEKTYEEKINMIVRKNARLLSKKFNQETLLINLKKIYEALTKEKK